ncbi:Vanillin dehydrogenase [Fonsecaea pedrosoi]|nr:Vanillin dehydrogenase [Fonsecaea pedrosoi]
MGSGGTPDDFTQFTVDSSTAVPLWLDGRQVRTSRTFEVVSPVTGKTLWHSSTASITDAEAAVESSQKAFTAWSKTKPNERREIILRAVAILERRKNELFHYTSNETGATAKAFAKDHELAIQCCKSVAGLIQNVNGFIPTLEEEGMEGLVYRVPYGVALGIAPWNAPCILGVRALVTPLAAGNTVILKGPEAAPAIYWAIASAFHEAGLPAGCLNTIIHQPSDASEITRALISHPHVKKVNFTGSSAVGAIVATLAGKHLKPVLMELGGKAPTIVCEDADLRKAALGCAQGAFIHGGQACMATERIIVHEKVVDAFRDILKKTIDQLYHGEPLNLVSKLPVQKNKRMIADAISKGARVIHGDEQFSDDVAKMKPVVIDNIKPDMDIYYTESFGPSVSLFSVSSDEEALQIANDTMYGLSSAVYTEDLKRGLRIAKAIETGAVHINSMSVHDEAALPHGGVKQSGFGRFNGREGLEEWVYTKVVTWRE